MGSIWGALLGAGIVAALPEVLRNFSQARLLVFGIILVLIMILRPQGIWPEHGLGLIGFARRLFGRVRRPPAVEAGSTRTGR
jgi:hypothetical protein